MKKDDYILLIYKNLKGELSPNEQELLTRWRQASTENQALAEELSKNWQLSSQYVPDLKVDTKAEFEPLRKRIRAHKASEKNEAKVVKMKPRRRWLSVAAAAILLIVAGTWWVSQSFEGEEMVAFSTAFGEKKSVTLKDGTVVYLNENSQLFYPINFKTATRTVKFSGEAYFEVAKNPTQPFIIETTDVTVEVLGTAFNLRAYPTETKRDILVAEGKVKFQANDNQESIILTANQEGIFNKGKLEKIENSTSNAYAWKSGVLSYKNTPLKEVLKDLERVFQIKTNLQNSQMNKCLLTGRFPNAQAQAILEYIATYYKMELVKIGAKQYRLTGGVCE